MYRARDPVHFSMNKSPPNKKFVIFSPKKKYTYLKNIYFPQMQNKPVTKFIAFDIEASGGTRFNSIVQLGAVLYDVQANKVLSTFNEYAAVLPEQWDTRCLEEFWMKNPDMYQNALLQCAKATKDQYGVMDAFVAWVQALTKDHEIDFLITDNAGFDGAFLKLASTDALYMLGKYKSIIDVSNVYHGMYMNAFRTTTKPSGMKSRDVALAALKTTKEFKSSVEHDHNPVNDATVMAEFFAFVLNNL